MIVTDPFGNGTPWYYHEPTDSIERIDFQSASETAQLACDLVLRIARSEDEIDFIRRPKPRVSDLELLVGIVSGILEHRDEVRLPETKFTSLARVYRVTP